MDDVRDAFARQGLGAPSTTACPVASPPDSVGAWGSAHRAREHMLPARSRSAITPMHVRPDVGGIVT